MTRLSRQDLRDFAQILVLANTPLSLFKGLTACPGMNKLRKAPPQELLEYYDRITARAQRSEFSMSLAYAVLCAILLHAREATMPVVDSSRLLWGDKIRDFLARSTSATNRFDVQPSFKPTIKIESSASSSTTSRILDPRGRPMIWRDEDD